MNETDLRAIAPRFTAFMGGYFDMDWRYEYSSVTEVYEDALGRMPLEWIEELRTEVGVIDQMFSTDEELQALLLNVGADLDPVDDVGLSPKMWIAQLSQWLTARSTNRG